MNIDDRLAELEIILPEAPKALAAYVPGLVAGEFLYISGQLPLREGKLLYSGRLGWELSLEEGREAARMAIINCLAVLKRHINNWDELLQVVKITGYIQSGENFHDQALVLNGASELLQEIFGERGRHARAAVGVNALPLNAACEVEMIALIRKDN